VIGQGTSSNDFTTIDWGAASHFLKTEMDIAGGSNYVTMGTMQFATVPYALHAGNVAALETRLAALEALVESYHPLVVDADGDGYTVAQGDCNDNDASIYPGAPDNTQDNIDNDCDGSIDEDYVVVTGAQVGDFREGGVVFWVDPNDNTHGLIMALHDQSSSVEWGCNGTVIMNGVIGAGAQNTIDIISACPTSGIAAELCANLTLNGYSDWFLPSVNELGEVEKNLAIIETAIIGNGGSSIVNNTYWTSTTYFGSSVFAIKLGLGFGTGLLGLSQVNYLDLNRVRAVRTF
jgi:hypothetical protein